MPLQPKPPTEILSTVIANLGGRPITLGGLIASLAILVGTWLIARLLVTGVKRLRGRMAGGGASLYIVEKLGSYGVVVVGAGFALSTLGLDLSSLAVFAGALGVGVGLGLQGVVKEFVSGLVLIFDSVLKVGDYVELPGGEVRGLVAEIGPRATRIRNNDMVDVFVPNSKLIEERFVNWTMHGQTRRIHIPFSVAYGVDKAKVRDAVIAAARTVPFTLPDEGARRTQVWMVGFGDSALNFELLVWPTLEAVKRPAAMQAAYVWAIEDALRQAGIEVPFPQRDVRVRAVMGREGDAALAALGLKARPSEAAEGRKGTGGETPNDAARDLLESDEPKSGPAADTGQ
ncbi:MAG TPA: mechanosensitive ion channel domain-containing protein [Caulobacteraceae bacterium]|nr:mechanosensitive ion channel domain-containing protein [Caulobacteraceae bacterium]